MSCCGASSSTFGAIRRVSGHAVSGRHHSDDDACKRTAWRGAGTLPLLVLRPLWRLGLSVPCSLQMASDVIPPAAFRPFGVDGNAIVS